MEFEIRILVNNPALKLIMIYQNMTDSLYYTPYLIAFLYLAQGKE